MRSLALGLAVCALGVWPCGPSQALAQGSQELDVRPGFDGLGKAGRWLPVQVVVGNDGPGFEAEVRVVTRLSAGGPSVAYGQPVDLPTRSRKLVQLVVPAPASERDLRLELHTGGREIAVRDVPVRLLKPSAFLVGVLSDDSAPPAGLGSLRRGGETVSAARVSPGDLPTDPAALQALDALVIHNAPTGRLSGEQRAALRTWVEAGGQLVLAGGPGWRRSIEGLDDLVPVEELWTREVRSLRAFGRYAAGPGVAPAGGPTDGGVLLAVGLPVPDARVLLEQDGMPLIVERWLGLGRITFVAADPALEPFRSWAGSEGLWQRILVGGRPLLPPLDEPTPSTLEPQIRGTLAQLMDLGLPGSGWLAALLLAYVLCVGPVQYVLLRRIDRREWAWLGFPALGIGFALLVYVGGGWLRGPEVRMSAVSIVRSTPGSETAWTDTYVGLVAPARRAYDLAFVDGVTLRALAGGQSMGVSPVGLAADQALIQQGRPTRLPGVRLEGRTLLAFQDRAFGPALTPVSADLRASSGRLEGLATNAGPDRLEGAVLVAAGQALPLGDIGPGESRPVSLALPTTRATALPIGLSILSYGPGSSTQLDQRQALLASLLGRGGDGETGGGAVLLAWSAATPPRLVADGVAISGAATRLVEQLLPVQYGEELTVIPPGLLGRTILDGAALGRGALPSAFGIRGPIVFQYDLPPNVSLARVDRLSVHLSLEGRASPNSASPAAFTPGLVRLSLLRWADKTWVDAPIGSSGVVDVPFGASFIDGGAIRVRVEPSVAELVVQQLDLSLEGASE